MQGIDRRSFRIIFEIELLGFLIFGVNKEGPPADDIGPGHRPSESVEKEVFAEALALFRLVEGQAGEKDNRNGMPWLPFQHARWNSIGLDASRRQTKVADHLPLT